MTIGNISSLITFLTNVDTSVFSNANRLLSINDHLNRVHVNILRSQDEWDYDDKNNSDLPILTADLVASQQYYTLPSGILDLKRLEISFDGTNFKRMSPLDINERRLDTANISDFSQTEPYYDIVSGDTIAIYPVPTANVTSGLKVWISRTPVEFTSAELTTGTKEPGFDSLFHQLLAYGPAIDFCIARNLPQYSTLKSAYGEMMSSLMNHYGDKQEDRVLNLSASYINYK